MYVSSCKSVDIRIDIFKYEEGFFIVVKIIEKEISVTNVSVKVRSNYNWIEWFSGVFGKVCLPVSICKRWLLTEFIQCFFFVIYIGDYVQEITSVTVIFEYWVEF